jgi:fermentation-respiration switch protein FrsA (DUF1100 family)
MPAMTVASTDADRFTLGASLRRMVLLLFTIIAVLVLLMIFFEARFIFFPTAYDGGEAWHPLGIEYQDVDFHAADGTRLHGWYFPHPTPRAVVLFAHGNAGNIAGRTEVARRLHRLGASLLLFDYRGYGRSEGSPHEAGLMQDARAARAQLAKLAGVEEAEIVLMGRSLGGAVVVELAARDGARGLILESTFTNLPDMSAIHYPWLPVRLLLRNRFDSLEKMPDYHGPLLQSHGNADRVVPLGLGRQLFEAGPQVEGEGKEFFLIQGGDHNDFPPPAYYEQLDRFLGKLP